MPDLSKYRHYADRFDISEERKDELLLTVWKMMESFVDQAFSIHPTQLATKLKRERTGHNPTQ